VDALAVGSQKGLMLPPGLAFVVLSQKARKRVPASTTPRFYLSLDKALKSLEGDLPDTPFTPAVSLLIQLRESLRGLEEEGIENVWARIALLGAATRAAILALGLKLLPATNFSNVVTAVDCAGGGPDPESVVKRLRDGYGLSIIGGQGKLKGRIFRIGHVGHVDELDVLATIGALEMVLRETGRDVKLGSGVAAAQEVFLAAKGGKNG
jgi:aspartate aminotransferase-like enzyme